MHRFRRLHIFSKVFNVSDTSKASKASKALKTMIESKTLKVSKDESTDENAEKSEPALSTKSRDVTHSLLSSLMDLVEI